MCIVSFKKINLNSKFRNRRLEKNNLQYTMCLFIPNNICKNIDKSNRLQNRLYDIKVASLQLIETVNLHISKLKNVVSNYVIHKNIIFQSMFSNKFK